MTMDMIVDIDDRFAFAKLILQPKKSEEADTIFTLQRYGNERQYNHHVRPIRGFG